MKPFTVAIQIFSICIFLTCVYFLKQIEKSSCADVEKSKREHLLFFAYFEVLFLIANLFLGDYIATLYISHPVLFIVPLCSIIGLFVWSIFSIEYIHALRKKNCPHPTMAEDVMYGLAIYELVVMGFLLFTILLVFGTYVSKGQDERRSIIASFTKMLSLEKDYSNKMLSIGKESAKKSIKGK